MNAAKNLIRSLLRATLKVAARYRVGRMRPTSSSEGSLVAALRHTLEGRPHAEERAWIDKIESLRARLNASSAEISIADYGAGKASALRTQEQMYAGTMVKQTVGDVCRRASKSPFWCLLLFQLIRRFKPANCIELGTCLGISGAYQAAALRLNGLGVLVTLEGAESLASLAGENLRSLGLDAKVVVGRFQDTLTSVLDGVRGSVDYAFIDGHHDETATISYFELLLPHLSPKALLVFDDISWSEGMRRAWSTVQAHQKVKLALKVGPIGVCVLDNDVHKKPPLSLLLVS